MSAQEKNFASVFAKASRAREASDHPAMMAALRELDAMERAKRLNEDEALQLEGFRLKVADPIVGGVPVVGDVRNSSPKPTVH